VRNLFFVFRGVSSAEADCIALLYFPSTSDRASFDCESWAFLETCIPFGNSRFLDSQIHSRANESASLGMTALGMFVK